MPVGPSSRRRSAYLAAVRRPRRIASQLALRSLILRIEPLTKMLGGCADPCTWGHKVVSLHAAT